MIELWSWPTPSGQKVHIALEELGLPYEVVPINIGKGEQFSGISCHDGGQSSVAIQWLMFQMASVGPMFGQHAHFATYAAEKLPYAIERYGNESLRILRVLDKRLGENEWLAGGEYSIADIATFPWTRTSAGRGIDMSALPNVTRWHEAMLARPAVHRGLEVMKDKQRTKPMTEEEKEILFGKKQLEAR